MTDQPIASDEAAKGAFARAGRTQLPTGWVKPARYRAASAYRVKYDRAVDLAKEIGPSILAGDRVDCLLSGNFIFGDLFEALATETGTPIDDLTMSTLSIGEENIISLGGMLRSGWLGTLAIVVSDYWWAHNRANAGFVADHLDIDGRFALAVAGTHTKIALLALGGRKIVAHGSANFRSSRSVETMTIETNPDLYDFHLCWHDRIIADYAVTGKTRRASALFDHIGGSA